MKSSEQLFDELRKIVTGLQYASGYDTARRDLLAHRAGVIIDMLEEDYEFYGAKDAEAAANTVETATPRSKRLLM